MNGFRARVLGLCLLAIVPIVTMEILSARESARQSLDAMRARASQMADTANEQYDDLLLKGEVVLDFMAAAPQSTGTIDECGAFGDTIKKRYPWITGIGVSSVDGNALCGEAARQHLFMGDKPYFQKAIATKQVTVSDFHIGPISHKPIISMVKPVLDANGDVVRTVAMGIDIKAFNELLASKKLADDVSVTFYDSSGTVLGRYPEADKYTGKNMSFAPLVQTILREKSGEYEGIGIANNSRQFSFRPFWGTSIYVAVGILDQPVLAKIHKRLIWNLAIAFGTICLAALISLIGAEILVFAPAKRLTEAAKSLGEGEFEALEGLHASMPEMAEMLTAFHDMAQNLKQRENDLKRSELETQIINRNLLLGEQIADAGYWRIDYPSQNVTWSQGMYRVFGLNPAQFSVTLENIISHCHEEDRKFISETIEMAVGLQRDFEYTARLVRPDGEIRYALTRGFCEIGSNGTVQSIFGAIIDVTVQKETEARLQLARQAAEFANRAKSDFLSSMSHELRTPLTSIIGFADLLLMRTRSVETRRYLKLQREAGQHLLSLISDILDHSKIEAGKLQLESIAFDIRALVESCVGVMAPQAEQKDLELSSIVGVTVPQKLIGDPGRLKQIILNLVGNAIKFTDNGSVTIKIDATGSAGDVVALHFSVDDSGAGITQAKTEKLFLRYAQADASTTRKFGGTGLGLAISKDLVEAMGGTIGVESTIGRGSSFWFNVRFLTASESEVDHHTAAPLRPKHGGRILLAEDSVVNQLLFTELLHALGHEVVAVADGAAAVDAVSKDGKFDLILMDVQMPIMDGLTATRHIRDSANSALPIIGMTANAMPEDVQKCLAAGMDEHIAKPVDIMILTDVIDRAMSGTIQAAG